jgi:hypothetical protein
VARSAFLFFVFFLFGFVSRQITAKPWEANASHSPLLSSGLRISRRVPVTTAVVDAAGASVETADVPVAAADVAADVASLETAAVAAAAHEPSYAAAATPSEQIARAVVGTSVETAVVAAACAQIVGAAAVAKIAVAGVEIPAVVVAATYG